MGRDRAISGDTPTVPLFPLVSFMIVPDPLHVIRTVLVVPVVGGHLKMICRLVLERL
jgi:hypothetical protein